MSTAIVTSEAERAQLRASTQSFFGIVRGELLKMSRRWSTWIPLALVLLFICAGMLIRFRTSGLNEFITQHPLNFLYSEMQNGLGLIRIFTGLYLLVLVAYVIGLEYQLGTIRILVARGVGKLTLLAAKVTSIVIAALLVLMLSTIVVVICISILMLAETGNLDAFKALTSQYWADAGVYMLTILVSTGVTILLGTAFSVLGRSLTIGLSAGLAWFPVDNIGAQFLQLAYRITQNNFWKDVTAYFLGPNLNIMARQILPEKLGFSSVGIPPLVTVDGAHTLWVTLAYAVLFLVVSVVLTWKRDIKE